MVIAAFVARIVGRGRSAFGTGGGRAATCGDAASADKSFARGVFAGATTGGVSPKIDFEGPGEGGAFGELGEYADIIACRWMGKRNVCEDIWLASKRAAW